MIILIGICALILPAGARADALDHLCSGCWIELGTNRIRDVLPSPLPYRNPDTITHAWNGGFIDTLRNRYVVMGGGHGDYAGNEIYAFPLATLRWSRIWGPTPNEFIPNQPATIGETYANGDPRSRHTYSGIQYFSSLDKYFVHGGSLWSGSGGMGGASWFFDPVVSRWTRLGDISVCYPRSSVPFTVYDPTANLIYAHKYNSLCEYNPGTNSWRKRGGYDLGISPNATSVFHPKLKQFCLIGGAKGAGQTRCYDMSRSDNRISLETILTTGDKTAENASYPGVDYDPISEQIIAWVNGADVYALDLTAKSWTKIAPAPSNTITPTPKASAGTHGRWRYVPSKNVFILLNDIDEKVYAYRKVNP
jgi:hypothetical protein